MTTPSYQPFKKLTLPVSLLIAWTRERYIMGILLLQPFPCLATAFSIIVQKFMVAGMVVVIQIPGMHPRVAIVEKL